MPQPKQANVLGRQLLIGFLTVHVDRAGETGQLVEERTEIIKLDKTGNVVAINEVGCHFFVPSKAIYEQRMLKDETVANLELQSDAMVAIHRLTRDFHNVDGPTVRTRWLDSVGIENLEWLSQDG